MIVNPKPRRGTATKERRQRAMKLATEERANKRIVRARDQRCRFPLCGCRYSGDACEVSHRFHKGMGGDSTGLRSLPHFMMLLCPDRHQHAKIAIDQKTLRWVPLTEAGSNGPVRWEIPWALVPEGLRSEFPFPRRPDDWLEIARELSVQHLESPTERQLKILDWLRDSR